MKTIKDLNYIYGLIEDNLDIIKPASLVLSGWASFGVPGALVGLGVSAINEYSTYIGITDDKFLNKPFIACSMAYTIYPSYMLSALGGCLGILIQTNNINELNKNYSNSIYPLIPIIVGAYKWGALGAFLGGVIAISDHALVHSNISDKHYLIYQSFGIAYINHVYGNSLLNSIAGTALGAIIALNKEKIYLTFESFTLYRNLYSTYSRVIEADLLNNYFSEHAESLVISQIILGNLLMKMLKYQQDMLYRFEHIDENRVESLGKLNIIAAKFFLFMLPFASFKLTSHFINNYYSTKLYLDFDNALRDKLFANGTALKLSFDKNATVLIDHLRLDSKAVSYEGAKLINDFISKFIKGTCGYTLLFLTSPDLLLYSMIYNQITQSISVNIANKQSELKNAIKQQESYISTLLKHDIQNIRIIRERDGIDYSKNKLTSLYDELKLSELELEQFSIIYTVWVDFISVTDFIYNYYLVGRKINIGLVKFDDRTNIHYSTWQASKLLSWRGKKAQEIETIYQSIERINLFLDKANSYLEESGDRIVRLYTNNNILPNKLVLSNLRVIANNQQLIHIDNLELNYGKIYALTGPSASGKSSFISKIMGVKENMIGSEGIINYPNNSKLISINQQDYFPLNVTLEEAIFYPNAINKSQTGEVKNLLKEISFVNYHLNQIADWYQVLSGGEKKKLLLISAIIKRPDILILDEAFNGLDQASVQTMQKIIKTILGSSLIISVDHNVNENNQTGFYTDRLAIINKNLLVISEMNYQEDICFYEEEITYAFNNNTCYENELYAT